MAAVPRDAGHHRVGESAADQAPIPSVRSGEMFGGKKEPNGVFSS